MRFNRYKALQYIKLIIVVLALIGLGASVLFYRPVGDQSIFLVTALIAVAPVMIFEYWNELKSPHVVLTDVEVVDFPHVVFDTDSEVGQQFNNGVCVRVYVKNNGFETARDCTCEFEVENTNDKYPARWSLGGVNPLTTDLSPNEEQFLDTLWYMYNGQELAVPTNIKKETDYGGNYQKSRPAGLNELADGRFRLLISASNMKQRSDGISLLGKRSIKLPEDLFEAKIFNPYTRSLLKKGNVAYAYAVSHRDWVLHKPENLDLHKLANMPYLNEVLFDAGKIVSEAQRPVEIKTLEED